MGRAPCSGKNELKKGPWTPEEDNLLIEYITKHGHGNWKTLPEKAGLQRCGKSCRLRWTNYLRPDIKRGKISTEEEETIVHLHSILGNKWSAIAARLPGRTDNEIKNYWNTHIRKKLLRMGIDPVTHTFRRDLLDLSAILNSPPYNSSTSQMNLSRLLRMQPSIDPELVMRIASSLVSSHGQNPDFLIENHNSQAHYQIPPSFMQNCQMQTPFQDFTINRTTFFDESTSVPLSGHDQQQAPQNMHFNDDVQNFSRNLSWFGSDNVSKVNEWGQDNGLLLPSLADDYTLPATNYGYNGSDQPLVLDPNPLSETCTFQLFSNNSFGFHSILPNISSPATGPAPLQFEFDLQC